MAACTGAGTRYSDKPDSHARSYLSRKRAMTNQLKQPTWYHQHQQAEKVLWMLCSDTVETWTEQQLLYSIQDTVRDRICFVINRVAGRELRDQPSR